MLRPVQGLLFVAGILQNLFVCLLRCQSLLVGDGLFSRPSRLNLRHADDRDVARLLKCVLLLQIACLLLRRRHRGGLRELQSPSRYRSSIRFGLAGVHRVGVVRSVLRGYTGRPQNALYRRPGRCRRQSVANL